MIIPEKMQDPLVIYLKSGQYYIDDEVKGLIPVVLNPLKEIMYGFIIISENNGIKISQEYATQFPLDILHINDDGLDIHEGVKHIPWKFDKSGMLLQKAHSFWFTMKDKDFLKEYGITTQDEIDEMERINSGGKVKKKVKKNSKRP